MKKPIVTVMMTCVNSQVAPGIIQLITEHPDYQVKIVGCDASPEAEILGRHFCHQCYSVPLGGHDEYIDRILYIVMTEGVQLLFPGSDEECLALSEHRDRFEALGCKIACSAFETVSLCFDKFQLMAHIREKGVQSGAVYLPTTLADLENFAHALGYPNFDFVIKPRSGHGSRGFHVVSSNYDLYEDFTASRSYTLSLEVLKDLFSSREQALSNYFLMEMFPGDKYSADVLVSRSRIHTMVIRNNGPIPKVNPPTQNARIVFDPDVRSYARRIIDALDFDYFVQVEVGRTRDDELGLVEVNTRMDATLPITEGLGLNFFREMITYAMTGKMRADIPYYHDYPKKLCFRRYWSHLFAEMDTHE